jgi:hypothetical protein
MEGGGFHLGLWLPPLNFGGVVQASRRRKDPRKSPTRVVGGEHGAA